MKVRKRKEIKHKTVYQVRWKDPEGKIKAKDFDTKGEAEKYGNLMEADILKADYSDPRKAKTKLIKVFEDWEKSLTNLKPKTKEGYLSVWRCLIAPRWANRNLDSINRAEVKSWITEGTSIQGNKVSDSRIRQAFIVLNLILNHAVDMNLIAKNPLKSGNKTRLASILPNNTPKKERRALELDQLITLANETGEFRNLILLAGLTGLRWAEIIALTPEDIDFKSNKLTVNKSLSEINGKFQEVTPKSGKSRTLVIPELLAKELRKMTLATEANARIFTSSEGLYLRHSNFMKRHFKPAAARIGFKSLTFHELRHTAISQALAAGADILTLSKIAGHANPAITLNVYGHQINDSALKLAETMDRRLLLNSDYSKINSNH